MILPSVQSSMKPCTVSHRHLEPSPGIVCPQGISYLIPAHRHGLPPMASAWATSSACWASRLFGFRDQGSMAHGVCVFFVFFFSSVFGVEGLGSRLQGLRGFRMLGFGILGLGCLKSRFRRPILRTCDYRACEGSQKAQSSAIWFGGDWPRAEGIEELSVSFSCCLGYRLTVRTSAAPCAEV